jgi:UDP-N-acetylmuramoylalanine--D-glutamate ligase
MVNRALIEELLSERILIWGQGLEGRSAEQFLHRIGHRHFTATADNDWVVEHYGNFDRILISPGISLFELRASNPAAAAMVADRSFRAQLTSQTDLFLKYYRHQTIGITGTKGKSTVAALITQVLADAGYAAELIGNIGRPALEGLMEVEAADAGKGSAELVWVYELSSYQLEFTHHSPHIAVTLNVAEDHVSHHGSLAAYREAKARIAQFAEPGDRHYQLADAAAVLRDHPELAQLPRRLLGQHNLVNLAFAYLVAKNFSVTDAQFARTVAAFGPLEHRLSLVGIKNSLAFYNDSIATNPLALMAGVQALTATDTLAVEFPLQTLIFGGQNKGLALAELTEFLRRAQSQIVDLQLIALPETGHQVARALGLSEKFMVPDLPTAVRLARQVTNPGRAVLFSPGAASFNQYLDFRARGQHFLDLVNG